MTGQLAPIDNRGERPAASTRERHTYRVRRITGPRTAPATDGDRQADAELATLIAPGVVSFPSA